MLLPQIGNIRTGIKNNKGYPVSIDYFIAKGKYESYFKNAYGEKPNVIQIIFPSDDPSLVCNERYEYRDNEGRLYASGDGESFDIWNGLKYKSLSIKEYPEIMSTVEKRCPNTLLKRTGSGWEITLTLSFIIPKIKGILGVWKYTTKGTASSIPQIRETFDSMISVNGFVKNVIFDLSVEFATSNKPSKKDKYPVVKLIPNESDENIKSLNLESYKQKILLSGK